MNTIPMSPAPQATRPRTLAGATNVFDPFNVRRSLYASAVQLSTTYGLNGFSADPE